MACTQDPGKSGADEEAGSSPAVFREVAAETGLDFMHFNGMSGELYFVEVTGSGVALFDYDNDGDLDVYLVQSEMLGPASLEEATFPPTGPLTDRLFRNDLAINADGEAVLQFTDVTEAAGLDMHGYGLGVAAGDYDNDGWVDLYVTRFESNALLRNLGNGRFAEVTETAGVDDTRWTASASFVDVDLDGWLDLYVCNYVNFTIAGHKRCAMPSGAREYCGPISYRSEPDRLLRNSGDGTFENATGQAGIAREFGGCLGVIGADFNGDNLPDLYVANDGTANQYWVNQGNLRFENDALMGGVALNWKGSVEASMGVGAADFDNDGDRDIFITHLDGETNTLYLNDGAGMFSDVTPVSGLADPSRSLTGFGMAWFDYDNDGWLDLFIANGAVKLVEAQKRAGSLHPLGQRNQLYRNLGNNGFEEVLDPAVGAELEVSRGTAVGDLDNDGDLDLVVTNNAGPVRLLRNEADNNNHWLGVRLLSGKRDAVGARVEVFRDGLPALWRWSQADGSYLSSNDPRVLVGLGNSTDIDELRVHWPDGKVESWRGLGIDRYVTLTKGEGQSLP
ncbi:MAG: CRTAC1 family protein [Gammaproteobacteria bacterium]|nr:CRTAC1 family protein [Gammaproteobacteria bacterium]NNM21375.1 CRTAC1 family protein [Gammaproteobacteria bacterium]